MIINLDKIYKIDIDFADIYIIDDKRKKLGKKELINTSTRVFDGIKYDNLYILEPRVAYLIPLPIKYQNNFIYIQNLIGETGIILQPLKEYILIYNTNENIIYLNQGIEICNIKEVL